MLAHEGDLVFSTPELMRKEREMESFSGGEVGEDGQLKLYRGADGAAEAGSEQPADPLQAWQRRMPAMWANVRSNPLLGRDEGEGEAEDGGSLGDLSDFDEADFEAFADSLLDESNAGDMDAFEHSLFGGGQPPPAATLGRAADDPDDLSDFENDLDDAIAVTRQPQGGRTSTLGEEMVIGGDLSKASSGWTGLRLGMSGGARPLSGISDFDDDIVYGQVQYDAIGAAPQAGRR